MGAEGTPRTSVGGEGTPRTSVGADDGSRTSVEKVVIHVTLRTERCDDAGGATGCHTDESSFRHLPGINVSYDFANY